MDDFIVEILKIIIGGCVIWDFEVGIVNGFFYDVYINFGIFMWWIVRSLEFF